MFVYTKEHVRLAVVGDSLFVSQRGFSLAFATFWLFQAVWVLVGRYICIDTYSL
jgi:hypothetical protein